MIATLRAIRRLFANILFAVSLFAVWGVLTLIGVIVVQDRDAAYYFATYPAPLARLLLRLGLDGIYHGPAYIGVIGLILASLAACTFSRVIPARLSRPRRLSITHMPLHDASRLFKGDVSALRATVDAHLRSQGWKIHHETERGVEWSYADRHHWARRGVLIAHLGFVIITAGIALSWARGFSGFLTPIVGETVTIPQIGARLHLIHFAARFTTIATRHGIIYQPMDYVSTIDVQRPHTVSQRVELRVNHPLDLDGTLIYQSSYGEAIPITLLRHGRRLVGPAVLTEGQSIALPGSPMSFRYTRFIGRLDGRGEPTKDPRPSRPAALLTALAAGTPVGSLVLPVGKPLPLIADYAIAAAWPQEVSGLSYRYDPGLPIVALGAFVLLSGLCICVYLLPARLYFEWSPCEDRWRLSVAATTVKGTAIFEEEFHRIVTALGTTLDDGDGERTS